MKAKIKLIYLQDSFLPMKRILTYITSPTRNSSKSARKTTFSVAPSLLIHHFFVPLLLCCLLAIPAEAQRKKKKQPAPNPIEVARTMMLTGNYPATIEYISTELTAQKKLRRPTCNVDSLEFLIDTLRIAEANIRSTQRIVFVDSIILHKKEAIERLSLHPEMGKIYTAKMLKNILNISFSGMGETAYLNALGDNAYLSVKSKSGKHVISRSIRSGSQWSNPEMLKISEQDDAEQDYPFLLSDGVSMYYAAQGETGLGGWDIYVTRYDNEDKTFLKPQNLGMPFNSEANDYMYFIDESTNTGYFLTDRRLSNDSVCLYTFIPNTSHTTFPAETDFKTLYHAAHIHSIAATQKGQEQRIEEWRKQYANTHKLSENQTYIRFIITNDVVYTNMDEFKSQEAQQIAQQLVPLYTSLRANETLLKMLRKQYSTAPSTAGHDNILQLEQERDDYLKSIKTLEKQMRTLEIEKLNSTIGK